MPVLIRSRFTLCAALAGLTLTALQSCDSAQFIPGSTTASGGLVYMGVTYSTTIDDTGNLVITTSDGAGFKIDPNGKVVESTSPGGARINVEYRSDTDLNIDTYFPEFANNARGADLKIVGDFAAQAVPTVCNVISERCDELDYYVNTILPTMGGQIGQFYFQQLGGALSLDEIDQIVRAHIDAMRNRAINFCSGWQLMLLLDQDPCGGTQTDDDGCDFIGGVYPTAIFRSPTGADRSGSLTVNLSSDGRSATGQLELLFPPPSIPRVVVPMTGTVRTGTPTCPTCVIFEGTTTNFFGDPQTFSIVFEPGFKKGEGNYQTEQGFRVAVERTDCN